MKYTKIDIFLIVGFLLSAFAFSLTISVVYTKYNKVIEQNEINKDYKLLEINIVDKTEKKDEENNVNLKYKKNTSLLEVVNEVQQAGYKKIILSPIETQIEVGNDSYINDIWACSAGIDMKRNNIVKGRYLTEEELSSNEKVAVIGLGLERLIEEKDGEKYIKVFEEYYKVIGILGDTEVFKYSSIIPIKSLSIINSEPSQVSFLHYFKDNEVNEAISNRNILSNETIIPQIPVIKYLFKNVYELKNCLYQVVLGIINLFLFSYFFSDGIKEKVAIMKVLGARNIDVFKEVFIKYIKIATIGIIGGLILSKFTIDFMRQAFTYQYSSVNVDNVIVTFISIFIISIIVSICVLFNVIRFKIMKEIR
ncbi:MacB-like core domain-containing protein [Clostridium sp. DSM 8431]|uniref:ABC transporter permease n=1 Tax=Clostridium sp. DSM 8431 TaxID=1761781 RepID=UPI0008E83CE4|nr:ABC transporter permease [Clostridium sp. DSM 8431]SFU86548.1 MacB-like core domain-containing protein [Clostridium sp. DSM 8431]